MSNKAAALGFLLALCISSCSTQYRQPPAELSIPNLDSAFEKCAVDKPGKDYISSSSMIFLKTANLDSCILKGDPAHKPISIYFNVDSIGKLDGVIVNPNDLLAYCIKENVSKLSLAPPPKTECTIRIMLSFEGEEAVADDEAG